MTVVRCFLVACLLASTGQLFGQDLDSLLNLNAFTEESELQKILNKNVAVSSRNGLTTRESPGIISLITSEEIRNSGARDMTDLLKLVPGFEVVQDLQFVLGIGLRGNWANEGKVLVLMDGHPFNEILYQTVALGNRFPVDAIERIEIIRGPGSAIYGGSAEYGVINIITKAAETLDGVAVYGIGGFHSNAVGRTNGGVMAASKGEVFSWDFSVFKGNGIVSDGTYQDLYQTDDAQDLSKVTRADPTNINLGLKYKGLSFRGMYDEFQTSDPTVFVSNKNVFTDLRYDWKLNEKLTVIPQVRYYNQVPWTFGDIASSEKDFSARATRLITEVDVNYSVSRKLNITAGGLYFNDKATDLLDAGTFSGANTLKLRNFAVFAEGLFKHRLVNATLGFRYEKNNRYGAAFVPRIALTKKIENFHFKVLFSQAFRAPSLQNINLAIDGKIKPEKSNVFELELGYQFTPEMLLAVNAFSITTKDVLIYGSEGEGDTFVEYYENFAKSGTNGFEVVYSVRKKRWYANLNYSFSRGISGNTVTTYDVPDERQYVGFPKAKITLNTNVYLTSHLSFNPTFIYATNRYAYTSLDEDGNPVIGKLDPYFVIDTFFNYRDILPGLNAGVGVYDLANQRPLIPQAYNGGFAPIPGRSRELILKISYQINFRK